jgi:glyoxylase-like metal-dependent hydrolase (beta-lactamase superfamily II)
MQNTSTMESPAEEVWVRVNGAGHAFSRELGCPCPRCRTVSFDLTAPPDRLEAFAGWEDPPWRAQTSASVLFPDGAGGVRSHLLVDVGSGVVESLACSGLRGLEHLAGLLITHWHPDHVLGLNQLCLSLSRIARRQGRPFSKVPVYTTHATFRRMRDDGGLAYELGRYAEFQEIRAGEPFHLPREPAVRVTPIAVAHGASHGAVEGAVIFAVETHDRKIIFAWDIDEPGAVLPSGELTNEAALREHLPLLRNADLLFMAANNWRAVGAGHTSYEQARDHYLEPIKVRRVYLIHVSGHEDEAPVDASGRSLLDRPGASGYGWTDARWDAELRRDRVERGHADNIRIARQGMLVRV